MTVLADVDGFINCIQVCVWLGSKLLKKLFTSNIVDVIFGYKPQKLFVFRGDSSA